MNLRLLAALLSTATAMATFAQQPAGVAPALQGLASQPATHTAFTLDRDMLQGANSYFGAGSPSSLSSVTFENYKYHSPAFYSPENWHELIRAYDAAGWKHLVNQTVAPGANATPDKPLTDLWLHFEGTEIDDLTVLLRGPKQMTVIEVSGSLRPLDLVHLSGHFGIPKVDPNAVMVPAQPGR